MSCSIIHCNFSRCICFSPASERLAGEDGCNSAYCFVQASHLWVKYLFFRIWCSVGLCLEAVPSRYTTGLQGISEGIVPAFSSWKPTKWKSYLSSLIIFFCTASKKPIAFNYSTFWSSLIIWSSLTNARGSLEFNIHIGKVRIMLVTCLWIYWLKWDTIVS